MKLQDILHYNPWGLKHGRVWRFQLVRNRIDSGCALPFCHWRICGALLAYRADRRTFKDKPGEYASGEAKRDQSQDITSTLFFRLFLLPFRFLSFLEDAFAQFCRGVLIVVLWLLIALCKIFPLVAVFGFFFGILWLVEAQP